MNDLTTIVIPCYKGEKYLAQAIESCRSQTHDYLEIIVVDDASPDGCHGIASEFARRDPRIRVLRHTSNCGVSHAFNSGFSAARGAFFSRLAQDDHFHPTAIAEMLQALLDAPKAGLVYCDELRVDPSGALLSTFRKPEPEDVLKSGNKLGICVMWRREVWERVGQFNPAYDTAEDYEYWLRVRQHFPIIHHPATLLSFRVHPEMGSAVYCVRQDLVLGELKARCATSRSEGRRYRAQGFFNAGYVCGEQGRRADALRYLARAALLRPFWFKPYKALVRFALFGHVRGISTARPRDNS